MTMTDGEARLARLVHKDEIRDVLAAYARGVDRGDGPLLKSCYHPDAIEEHGGRYTGNAHEYVDGAIPRIMGMDAMQHVLGTSHFDFVGDDLAYVETYIVTLARITVGGETLDTFTGGRLIDRFERRDGRWKIAHRRTIFDWNRDTPTRQGWVGGMFVPGTPGMRMGCKGPTDPSYERC
jgi:ketosteroid isomerase-like protein